MNNMLPVAWQQPIVALRRGCFQSILAGAHLKTNVTASGFAGNRLPQACSRYRVGCVRAETRLLSKGNFVRSTVAVLPYAGYCSQRCKHLCIRRVLV